MFKNSTSPRFGRVKFAIAMEGPAPFIQTGAVTFTYPFNTTYGITYVFLIDFDKIINIAWFYKQNTHPATPRDLT